MSEQKMIIAEDGTHKVMYTCFICGRDYQMGPHIYEGRNPRGYNFSVCKGCYEGNWDGWAPHYEEKILKRMGGKAPERNERGWFPRDIG